MIYCNFVITIFSLEILNQPTLKINYRSEIFDIFHTTYPPEITISMLRIIIIIKLMFTELFYVITGIKSFILSKF